MNRLLAFIVTLALCLSFAAQASAWPRTTFAQRRAIRQTQRQAIRAQRVIFVPGSTIVAPQGFYGPAIVPPQTIIIR